MKFYHLFFSLFGWLEKCKDQSHTLFTMIFLMVSFHCFDFCFMEKMCFSSVKRDIRKKTGTSFQKKKLLKTQFMQYSPSMSSINYSNCVVFKVRFYLFVSTLLEDLNRDCSCACLDHPCIPSSKWDNLFGSIISVIRTSNHPSFLILYQSSS